MRRPGTSPSNTRTGTGVSLPSADTALTPRVRRRCAGRYCASRAAYGTLGDDCGM